MTSPLRGIVVAAAMFLAADVRAEPSPVGGEPCVETPDGVTCTPDGFKKLVTKCVGYRTDRDICAIDLGLVQKKLETTQASLKLCQDTPIRIERTGDGKGIPGFLFGAIGTGLMLAPFLFPTAPTDTRVIIGTAGLAVLGTGVWIALP